MSKPVVYLGPSLPLDEAVTILDADYRPPVKRGDLASLKDAEIVVIIDGVFLQNCSVGHREILALLDRGVKVLGGGSMGALRAAELESFGMIGVGKVFQMYRSGEVQGDDEVALVFDPETLLPLSEPTINIRSLLDLAEEAGEIDGLEKGEMLVRFRDIYYPRRTVQGFLRVASEVLKGDRLASFNVFFSSYYRDIKKEDTITILELTKGML